MAAQQNGHLNKTDWEKLFARWSAVPVCPEVRLACAVIASGIAEELSEASRKNRPAFVNRNVTESLKYWCALIGIQWPFVLDRIGDSNAVDVTELRAAIKKAKALHIGGLNVKDER